MLMNRENAVRQCWLTFFLALLQVSVSGQAVVFIVRTMSWSVTARAGLWTYIAFFLAQVGSQDSVVLGEAAAASPTCGYLSRKHGA